MTGGLEGVKESYGSLVDRVSSFGKYTFFEDIDKYPAVKALFSSEKFVRSAEKVCPSQDSTGSAGDSDSGGNLSYLDPFQFNFIMQVPGQTGLYPYILYLYSCTHTYIHTINLICHNFHGSCCALGRSLLLGSFQISFPTVAASVYGIF